MSELPAKRKREHPERYFRPGRFCFTLDSLLRLDGGADERERAVRVAAQRRHGGDADDDNQGQHHGIFNGRRAVFRLQERHHGLGQAAHRKLRLGGLGDWNSPTVARVSARSTGSRKFAWVLTISVGASRILSPDLLELRGRRTMPV